MPTPIQQLEQLRKHRSRAGKDWTIARVIADTQEDAKRTHKKFGELVELWERLVPGDLAVHTSLSNFRAGVLHVSVDSSSAAFELDRLLRSGIEAELRRQFRGTLVRVKTRFTGAQRTSPSRRARPRSR